MVIHNVHSTYNENYRYLIGAAKPMVTRPPAVEIGGTKASFGPACMGSGWQDERFRDVAIRSGPEQGPEEGS